MRRRSARARRAAARRLLVLVAFCAMTISRTRAPDPVIDPKGAAVLAGLRCVSDETPDITLCEAGASFRDGSVRRQTITDPSTLARIRNLAIPPAWTDGWIWRDATGHPQANDRDARRRTRYLGQAAVRDVRKITDADITAQDFRTLTAPCAPRWHGVSSRNSTAKWARNAPSAVPSRRSRPSSVIRRRSATRARFAPRWSRARPRDRFSWRSETKSIARWAAISPSCSLRTSRFSRSCTSGLA